MSPARERLEAMKRALKEGRGFCCKAFLIHSPRAEHLPPVDVGKGKHYSDKPKSRRK